MEQQKQCRNYDNNSQTTEQMSNEQIILSLIYQNEIDTLKEIQIKKLNLNFLEMFPEIDIDNKISPLICASYLGRFDVVKMILANPFVDIDMASEDIGHTPLSAACITGNYEIIKLLIDNGAELNKPTQLNATPFLCCFLRLEEEQNLFENRKICLKMAELLLQHGADIDWIIDKTKGFTLLMQLCHNKMEMTPREMDTNYGLIQFLLENGANPKIQSLKGKNALDLTKKHCNKEKLQELIQNAKQIYFWNSKPQIMNANQKLNQIDNQQDEKKSKNVMKYLAICKNN